MKILLTGAHFTPAQAVIEQLQKIPNTEIIYIGRKYTMEGDKTLSVESTILPKLSIKFLPITAGRLSRFISLGTFISAFKIPVGFIQAFYYLATEKPQLVVSFGGYVGLPVVICAWLFSIPVLVHEQTLVAGLANTISNWFATKIAVSFDTKYTFAKSKLTVTGNPIRQELLEPNSRVSAEVKDFIRKNSNLPVILVMGGNQGSHVINETIGQILPDLLKKMVIIHHTGDSKYKDFEKLIKQKEVINYGRRYLVTKWMGTDLGYIYKNIDLAVCRSGANSLLELAYFGIPTITIPIPYLYKNEQMTNAKFFAQHNLCQIIPQDKLNAETLKAEILKVLDNLNDYKKQAQDAKKVFIPDAAKKITQQILILTAR